MNFLGGNMNERDLTLACLRYRLARAKDAQARVIKEAIRLIESGAYVRQCDEYNGLYIFVCEECEDGPWAVKNGCSCLDWERNKTCPHVLIVNIVKWLRGET